MATREPIFVALWNLIANDSRVKGRFVMTGRVLVPITELKADTQLPALFMTQHGEAWVRPGKGIPAKRTLQASFVAYAYAAQDEQPPATLLNSLMDVIDDVIEIPGNPGNVQTLGGLVEHVYLEGEVQIIEGQLGTGENASVLVVPVTMLIP